MTFSEREKRFNLLVYNNLLKPFPTRKCIYECSKPFAKYNMINWHINFITFNLKHSGSKIQKIKLLYWEIRMSWILADKFVLLYFWLQFQFSSLQTIAKSLKIWRKVYKSLNFFPPILLQLEQIPQFRHTI